MTTAAERLLALAPGPGTAGAKLRAIGVTGATAAALLVAFSGLPTATAAEHLLHEPATQQAAQGTGGWAEWHFGRRGQAAPDRDRQAETAPPGAAPPDAATPAPPAGTSLALRRLVRDLRGGSASEFAEQLPAAAPGETAGVSAPDALLHVTSVSAWLVSQPWQQDEDVLVAAAAQLLSWPATGPARKIALTPDEDALAAAAALLLS